MSEQEKLRFEAMHMALRHNQNCAQYVPVEQLVRQAKTIMTFLEGKEASEDPEPELPLVPEGYEPTVIGLFDEMHKHEKADPIPWRAQRGLE